MIWHEKKGLLKNTPDTSDANPDGYWLIDDTPEGLEEAWHFEHPNAYVGHEDTRNALENHDYQRDIEGKRDFRVFATRVGGWWAFMLGVIIFAQGLPIPFQLTPEEFIAVVTTTTASIFGITFVVGRYLYGSKAYVSKTNASDSVSSK
ncbi:hypothetical protein [Marivita sp.]|uniref:hypothetical protein n=1 Tax=Marivita sp. TaxID=2003365 RepID=UPI0025BB41DB|nr:hypothetical protein [Marivita sp.]